MENTYKDILVHCVCETHLHALGSVLLWAHVCPELNHHISEAVNRCAFFIGRILS